MDSSKYKFFKSVNRRIESICENHVILERFKQGLEYSSPSARYRCNVHNEEHIRQNGKLYREGCKFCFEHARYQERCENFLKRLSDVDTNNEFELVSEYVNAKTKVGIKHHVCGEVFYVTPDSFLSSTSCPNCTNSMYNAGTLKKYYEKYKDYYEKEGFQIILDNPNKKMLGRTRFKIKHLACNNVITVTHDGIFNKGFGCRHCSSKNSRVHAIVNAILKVNKISYETEYRFDDCKYKYRLPFDFKVDISKDEFILIEVDGRQHYKKNLNWYSDDIVKRDKIKTDYCKDNKITLVRLKVDDYKTIDDVYVKICEVIDVKTSPSYKVVDKFYNYKITSDVVEQVRKDYLFEGLKTFALTEKYDLDSKSISSILNYRIVPDILPELKGDIKERLKFNSNKPPRRDSKLLPYKDQVMKLRKEGNSFAKIAKVFNVSPSCVRTFFVRHCQP